MFKKGETNKAIIIKWHDKQASGREHKYPINKVTTQRNKKVRNLVHIMTQGKSITIVDARNKIQGFQKKLDLWSRRVQKGIYANFPTFDD